MRKGTIIIIVIVTLVITFAWFLGTRNKVVTLEEAVNLQQSNVEAQLQRRMDLIPNLVSTAKGYAKHEEAVFTAIADARAALLANLESGDVEEISKANNELDIAFKNFLAIAENYPELKSDKHYIALMDELSGSENRISVARQHYNESVSTYNTYVRKFPQVFWGFKQLPYFEAASGASTVPVVNFD